MNAHDDDQTLPRIDAQSPEGAAPVPGRTGRRRLLWAGLALAGAGLGGGCALLDQKQRQWVFQPSKDTWWGGQAAAEGMDDVWIDYTAESGDGVRIHGLWLGQPRADAPVLLYLHGARWDVRGSAPRIRRKHALGFAVLGIDYRGFGRSTEALPSEQMALEDARAAWDWLAQRHPQAPRFVFGHSLGGALAVQLAASVPGVAGLMVENSFPSVMDVVRTSRWGWVPVGPLVTQRFDAGRRMPDVRAPVLVVHGSADTLIPPELGRALYERATAPKRFVLVDGGSHHSTHALAQGAYRQAMADLFGLAVSPE